MLLFQQTEDPSLSALAEAIDTSRTTWTDLLWAGVILVSALMVSRIVRIIVRRVSTRTGTDTFLGDLVGRIAGYVIVAFGLVYALESLGIAVAPILGALGIVGIALAFALREILENFVAGIMLQLRRPFTTGDEVESNSHEGTVISVDARSMTIRTPAGETVHLPNAEVMHNPIINHTELGRRRTTLEVGVAYDSDLDAVSRIAHHATASVDGVLQTPGVEIRVFSFGPSSIDVAIRFWHEPSIASMWSTRDRVARAVSQAFGEHDIEIPFPQHVLHSVAAEETR